MPYALTVAIETAAWTFAYRHHYQRRQLFFHFSYYCKCRRLVEIRQQIMRQFPASTMLHLPDPPFFLCRGHIQLLISSGSVLAPFSCRCQRHDVLMSATCSAHCRQSSIYPRSLFLSICPCSLNLPCVSELVLVLVNYSGICFCQRFEHLLRFVTQYASGFGCC